MSRVRVPLFAPSSPYALPHRRMMANRIAGLVAGWRCCPAHGRRRQTTADRRRPVHAGCGDRGTRGGPPSPSAPMAIPARFAAFGLPVLSDGIFHDQGPLAGLLAGLEWAATLGMAALLTAPGDTPFLPSGLAKWLAPPPCCVSSAGRRHHLIALWPVDRAPDLRRLLSDPGPRQVAHFAKSIGMRYADSPCRRRSVCARSFR